MLCLRGWLKLLLVASVLLVTRRAEASACCGSATVFGVGRLLLWERAAFGVQVGHVRMLGNYGAKAAYYPNASSYSEGLTSFIPYAIVRVHDRIQLQAWVPVLVNDRRQAELSQVSGMVGDVGFGARFELLAAGAKRYAPGVALLTLVEAPSGRRIESTEPPLFAGTTGLGAWAATLNLELEGVFAPGFLTLVAGVTGYAPYYRSDLNAHQLYGPRVRAALIGGAEFVPNVLVGALSLQFEWQNAIYLRGEAAPDSSSSRLVLAASLSWRVAPHWTLLFAAQSSVWPAGFLRNTDARAGVTIGARYGLF